MFLGAEKVEGWGECAVCISVLRGNFESEVDSQSKVDKHNELRNEATYNLSIEQEESMQSKLIKTDK